MRWMGPTGTDSASICASGTPFFWQWPSMGHWSSTMRSVLIGAAIDGVGLTFLMGGRGASYLSSGQLIRVFEDWCEPFAGSP
jgi:hypothetical protein